MPLVTCPSTDVEQACGCQAHMWERVLYLAACKLESLHASIKQCFETLPRHTLVRTHASHARSTQTLLGARAHPRKPTTFLAPCERETNVALIIHSILRHA
jgi:hypothetical protein